MPILALVTEYQNVKDEQVVVLFQILAAEINFGYRFQTVRCETLNGTELKNLTQMATLVDSCQCVPCCCTAVSSLQAIAAMLAAPVDAPLTWLQSAGQTATELQLNCQRCQQPALLRLVAAGTSTCALAWRAASRSSSTAWLRSETRPASWPSMP